MPVELLNDHIANLDAFDALDELRTFNATVMATRHFMDQGTVRRYISSLQRTINRHREEPVDPLKMAVAIRNINAALGITVERV